MRTYRLTIEPLAPRATPWHADTLFSALACQLAKREGDDAVRKLLNAFAERNPPFVLSDAFPEGWFPCPLSASVKALPESNIKHKLPAWVTQDQFQRLIRSSDPFLPLELWPCPVVVFKTLHASIDRCSGTTAGSGSLFEVEAWHLAPEHARRLVIYVRAAEWLDRLVELFRSLSCEGFGKKRSAGWGGFRLVDDPEACPWMDHTDGANGYVSLSHFIPAANDPTDGCWSLLTKYPKFSPGFPANTPFKGRVLMLRPGSAFRVSGEVRLFYGGVLRHIGSEFPDAVHYGLAFALPLRWHAGNSQG